MPSNLKFRYSICSCKSILRAEQASRHFKLNDTHTPVKVYTCCVSCCVTASEEAMQSGDFYRSHSKCTVYAANSVKTRVFLQMKLKEEKLDIALGGVKRIATTSLASPAPQRPRTLSCSSSSSSTSSSESDFEVSRPPPTPNQPMASNEEELSMALQGINAQTTLTDPTSTEAESSQPAQPQPETQQPQPETQQPQPQAETQQLTINETSPTRPTTWKSPLRRKTGIKAQGKKWEKDTHLAAVSQTINIIKLLGKIKTQESTINSLQQALETAQRKLIEN